jgi:hypothetical protein
MQYEETARAMAEERGLRWSRTPARPCAIANASSRIVLHRYVTARGFADQNSVHSATPAEFASANARGFAGPALPGATFAAAATSLPAALGVRADACTGRSRDCFAATAYEKQMDIEPLLQRLQKIVGERLATTESLLA